MSRGSKVYELVTVALMSAVLCIISPITLNMGPIPLSMTTLVMYVYVYVFDVRKCIAGIFVYIGIGLVGIPVFSGYTAGVGQLLGPTGGFIMGYIIMCIVSGILLRIFRKNCSVAKVVFALLCGTCILYTAGVAWYMLVTGNSLAQSVAICVVPFVVTDIVKILASVLLGRAVRKRLVVAGIEI